MKEKLLLVGIITVGAFLYTKKDSKVKEPIQPIPSPIKPIEPIKPKPINPSPSPCPGPGPCPIPSPYNPPYQPYP